MAEKSFYYLTEDEIRKMKEAVTRLAQRLKNIVSLKRSRAKRGVFDLQRTLRHNIQYGGVEARKPQGLGYGLGERRLDPRGRRRDRGLDDRRDSA